VRRSDFATDLPRAVCFSRLLDAVRSWHPAVRGFHPLGPQPRVHLGTPWVQFGFSDGVDISNGNQLPSYELPIRVHVRFGIARPFGLETPLCILDIKSLHKDKTVFDIDHAVPTAFNLDSYDTPHAKPSRLTSNSRRPTTADRVNLHVLDFGPRRKTMDLSGWEGAVKSPRAFALVT